MNECQLINIACAFWAENVTITPNLFKTMNDFFLNLVVIN